jgi:pheromone shutdown-related protein TraB
MIHLIGTAHISKDSITEVEETIHELKPDLVAVELCESRYRGLTEKRDIPILELLNNKNAPMLLINVVLSFLQRKMGHEVGVKPGEEMLTAVKTAERLGCEVAFIDRDIGITLKRAINSLGFFEKLKVIKELLTTFSLTGDELEREIDEMKKDERVTDILAEFSRISPGLYQTLVKERDAFMSMNLLDLQKEYGNIVAVVGAGHKKGISSYLEHPETLPDRGELLALPKSRFSLTRVLKFGIPALILAMFLFTFYQGMSLREPLGLWILINAIPTFIMVLIAGGHLISAVVGMLASPLTSLNPMMAAGWFAGATELKVRNVTVKEVSAMFNTTNYRELYRNNAFKVLLVTAFANLGSMLGTFSFIAYYISEFWYMVENIIPL